MHTILDQNIGFLTNSCLVVVVAFSWISMEASLFPQSNHGIMDEEEDDELGSMSSSSLDNEDGDDGVGDATSSSLDGPLFEMTSLISQLPFKRGLSKHFGGKSQSFTSLSNVKRMEDLAKPERPLMRRKLRPSKSYGFGLDTHKALFPKGCSRAITKKRSRGSSSSLGSISIKKNNFLTRPSCLLDH